MNIDPYVRGITSDQRRGLLRERLRNAACLRVIEVHSPISALLAERACADVGGQRVRFDAMWSSSLSDSTQRALPDTEFLDIKARLQTIHEIFDATSLPMIVDGDTGGQPEHLARHLRALELSGASALIIEDKTGLKKNSLFGNTVAQQQAGIDDFCGKIHHAQAHRITDDFMLIARIESLVLEAGMDDALKRANAYVGAGADAIMIHSRRQDGAEILEFAKRFRRCWPALPLICVPTTYDTVHFDTLTAAGFNIVIYANHLSRSAYLAMTKTADSILRHGRSHEAEATCMPVNTMLDLVPGTR